MLFNRDSALRRVIVGKDGGVYFRIDETRALLDLIQREAPELLRAHPCVARWLRTQDDFLGALQAAVPGLAAPENMGRVFPRAWPVQTTPSTWVGAVVKDAPVDVGVVRPLTRKVG